MTSIGIASHANPYAHTGHLYQAAYDKMLGNTTLCAKVMNFFSKGILLTVFVIGCIGSAQVLSASIIGWSLVGLGAGYMAIKLLAGKCSQRKMDLISSAIICAILSTFGGLGIAGVLSNAHIGFAMIGGVCTVVLVTSFMMIGAKRQVERTKREN